MTAETVSAAPQCGPSRHLACHSCGYLVVPAAVAADALLWNAVLLLEARGASNALAVDTGSADSRGIRSSCRVPIPTTTPHPASAAPLWISPGGGASSAPRAAAPRQWQWPSVAVQSMALEPVPAD